MKHLLSGVAIAAALAIAAPVWAAENTAMPPAPGAQAPAAHAAAKPAKHRVAVRRHRRRPVRQATRRHRVRRGRHVEAGGNRMTEQLNREELARIQAGSAGAAPAAPPPAPGGMPPGAPPPPPPGPR